MIILEGADLTGKTTLAALLGKEFNSPVVSLGRPKPDKRHWEQVKEALVNNTLDTVYDRMVIGATIYPKLMKDAVNEKGVTPAELEEFYYLVQRMHWLVVYCDCGPRAMEERFALRGDDYVDLSQAMRAARMYDDFFRDEYEQGRKWNELVYYSDIVSPEIFIEGNRVELTRATNLKRLPTTDEVFNIQHAMR